MAKLFETELVNLSPTEREAALSVLKQYSAVFSQDKWHLGRCDLHKLNIQLKEGAQPMRVPYRAMNPSKRKDAWVTRYDVPDYIHSDNGTQLTSQLFQDMCQSLSIAFHPNHTLSPPR